jgi:hypothetical protein
MNTIRRLTATTLAIAVMLATWLPAAGAGAMPAPPDGNGSLQPPTEPVQVLTSGTTTPVWVFLLVAAAAVVVTLTVVTLVNAGFGARRRRAAQTTQHA